MLVLGRKEGESILIDGNIRVTLLKVQGQTVRLGIEAPRHVPVLRSELDLWENGAPGQDESDDEHNRGRGRMPELSALT